MNVPQADPVDVTDNASWFLNLLDLKTMPSEGAVAKLGDEEYQFRDGILRQRKLLSDAQRQTENTFGFKWNRRDSYGSAGYLEHTRKWLEDRYGDSSTWPWLGDGERPSIVLDAGCGAGVPAIALFDHVFDQMRYVGVDISTAIDASRDRWQEQGRKVCLIQADLSSLPFAPGSIDVIFSEGVLHHTDSTKGALLALADLIRPGGYFMFYVYRKKGPIREFTDDYVRDKLASLSPEEAWDALMPLTKLGKQLGELGLELEIEEPIDLLGIPAGKIDLQRFVYWHVFKAFHRDDMPLEELNFINFDWYMPANAHRQTVEQVRDWCAEANLVVTREVVEEAGITIVAQRQGPAPRA